MMKIPNYSQGMLAALCIAGISGGNAATVDATFSSKNVLQGNFESGTSSTFLTNNSNARRVGTGGAGGAQRVNQPVLGFTLPVIPAGDIVDSVTFEVTLDTPAITGAPIGFDMVVSLMNQTDISGFSGADFTEDESSLGNGTLVSSVNAGDVSNGEALSFDLTGPSLTQFASLYDAAGSPTQSEVWFRLSTSAPIDISVGENDNDRFNLETVGGVSSGDIVTTLSIETVPEPTSSMLLGLGALGLAFRRRR